MASTTGWNSSTNTGAIGNDQSLNNSSGFNAFPEGNGNYNGSFGGEGNVAVYWRSTEYNSNDASDRTLTINGSSLSSYNFITQSRFSVRFVRD